MDLGNRLIDLRKKKGLSQEEAAEKLGVTRQTISKWETGASTPDFDKIMPICNLYNITTDELIGGNSSTKENATDDNNEVISNKDEELIKQINGILALLTTIIYLLISFSTYAWHVTWIIWIIYALVCRIVKLSFYLRGNHE